jgi:hypothetical protein
MLALLPWLATACLVVVLMRQEPRLYLLLLCLLFPSAVVLLRRLLLCQLLLCLQLAVLPKPGVWPLPAVQKKEWVLEPILPLVRRLGQ